MSLLSLLQGHLALYRSERKIGRSSRRLGRILCDICAVKQLAHLRSQQWVHDFGAEKFGRKSGEKAAFVFYNRCSI